MDITHSEFEIAKVIELPEDEVQLWRVDLEAIAADESRWRNVLSTDELNARFPLSFSPRSGILHRIARDFKNNSGRLPGNRSKGYPFLLLGERKTLAGSGACGQRCDI